MLTRTKVRGMIIGTAVGDALGMPVETFSADKIKETFGRIEDYVSAENHKWFDGREPGTWTDDTQLTLAVANALISKGKFDMDAIGRTHVDALKNPAGWGSTTREAIQRIRDGVHWKDSASESLPNKPRGYGNGVPMKISPVSVYHLGTGVGWKQASAELALFSQMTHNTTMGIASGLSHGYAMQYCLKTRNLEFEPEEFINIVVNQAKMAETIKASGHDEDKLATRFEELHRSGEYTTEDIIENFGAGSCYVYDSLPFSYAFFLKGPRDFDTVLETVNAGGDTDSNASMVAALMGALNGEKIFPANLVDKLDQKEVLLDAANSLCDAFDIKE